MNKQQSNLDPVDAIQEKLRKSIVAGEFGRNAVLHEARKARTKLEAHKDLCFGLPEDQELFQALLLFAANQPSLDFLLPYIYGDISKQEVEIMFKAALNREQMAADLILSADESLASFKEYEIKRNRRYIINLEAAIVRNYFP